MARAGSRHPLSFLIVGKSYKAIPYFLKTIILPTLESMSKLTPDKPYMIHIYYITISRLNPG